jgi:hypothetical protein
MLEVAGMIAIFSIVLLRIDSSVDGEQGALSNNLVLDRAHAAPTFVCSTHKLN